MGLSGGMEAEDEDNKNNANEDLMVFLRKHSETNSPRYATRLKTYVDLHHKRRRAAAARRHSDQQIARADKNTARKKPDEGKALESVDHQASKVEEDVKRHARGDKSDKKSMRSRSGEPSDKGCKQRRRRRRSCGRRRRRRRRSCSRRRRRRSCRRRRKRCSRRRRR